MSRQGKLSSSRPGVVVTALVTLHHQMEKNPRIGWIKIPLTEYDPSRFWPESLHGC